MILKVKPLDKTQKGKKLIKTVQNIVVTKKYVVIPAINKRKVYLDKFVEANKNRNHDRLRLLPCAIELVKKTIDKNSFVINIIKQMKCYEIIGILKNDLKIKVHIREETERKDKILRLISCFYAK